jgi:hypothetical protein
VSIFILYSFAYFFATIFAKVPSVEGFREAFFWSMSHILLLNLSLPLSIPIGFVPRLFPFLSGLISAENLFSAFIVEEIEK